MAITRLDVLLELHPEPAWLIGAATGIDPSTLCKYRRAVRSMPIRHARRLAEYLGVTMEQVMGRADSDFLEWAHARRAEAL